MTGLLSSRDWGSTSLRRWEGGRGVEELPTTLLLLLSSSLSIFSPPLHPPPPTHTHTQSDEKPPSPEEPSPPPPAPISPGDIQFRNKTPSQYPTELVGLTSELREVEDRGKLVRRGRGLFTLMKNAEEEKVRRKKERKRERDKGGQGDGGTER